MRRRLRLAAALACLAAAAWAADVQETVAAAYQAFLEGRLVDAVSGFRYLATLGVSAPDPDGNLALLARDGGDNDEALALWTKATLSGGVDGFVWDQRAWSYLSAGRMDQARQAFLMGIDRSSTTASQAEANLGLGLTALLDHRPKTGLDPLRAALVDGPYAISAASYETALTALAMRDQSAALAYLRQSLDVDPLNFESLAALARLEEKVGETRPAWRLYHRLQTLEPANPEWGQHVKKLSQYITGDPQLSMPIRRLARPLLSPEGHGAAPLSASTMTVRVAIFSDRDSGKPATVKHLYLVVNSDFKLTASNTGEIVKDDGRALDQWEISFHSENNLVEVRDAARNIQYTSKQPFRIESKDRQGSILLKSGEFVESSGFQPDDRELRGAIEIIPTPYGFKVVDIPRLEDYLYGVVGAALPQGGPAEAYKAEAVVARTLALWQKIQAAPNWERAELCDSEACQSYAGVSDEIGEASRAVAATEGLVLTLDDRVAHVAQHENCGGRTESGAEAADPTLRHLVSVDDGPAAAPPSRTPEQLERWTHEFPPRDRFCEADNIGQSRSRWVRLISAEELEKRAERGQHIGSITNLRALRRSATGRIQSLEVRGARGTLKLEGPQAIVDFLSPGSLRSTLFTVTPVLVGKSARHFLLWGAGAGGGLGLCRSGAIGQASLGKGFRSILAFYFPELKLEDLRHPKQSAKSPKPRRRLNPRYRP